MQPSNFTKKEVITSKRKIEFKVQNVTFYYDKPNEIDILTLKLKVKHEGFEKLGDAEFMHRVIENYVTVRKGFITKKVTWTFLEKHSNAFIEDFLRKLVTILI